MDLTDDRDVMARWLPLMFDRRPHGEHVAVCRTAEVRTSTVGCSPGGCSRPWPMTASRCGWVVADGHGASLAIIG
jgi:hypothetical protein